MIKSVTVENISPGVWGVWDDESLDIVGYLRRYRLPGRAAYWNAERGDGRVVERFATFGAARTFAKHYERWRR